jgi:branched-chain amino acid transport system permease protein
LKDLIAYALLGLGAGGLYAMLGTGVVVAFRGSGVINFAHGALAMYSAFTYDELRHRGRIALPWFDILPTHNLNLPVHITLKHGTMPFVPSFAIALLMAVFLGLGCHFLVFRPLRNAPPLGKVIGSVGIMLYLQAVAVLNFGTENRQGESIVPNKPWRNFLGLGKAFQQNKLWIALIASLLAMGLWAFYRYTRFGLATRAAASNEKGATVLGYNPQLLAASSWVMASVLGAIAGILYAPISGLDASSLTSFVIPSLSAALVGSLSSVPITVVAGLLLGMLSEGVAEKLPTYGWFPNWLASGIKQVIPLFVVIVVLYFRGDKLPVRGSINQIRLPRSPEPKHLVRNTVIPVAIVLVLANIFTGPWELALNTSMIAAIMMLSLVVLVGYVGQISLANLTLAGVASFSVARFAANGKQIGLLPVKLTGLNLPFPFSAFLAVAVATIVGIVIGFPALRIRGVQLAVVTITASTAITEFYFRNKTLVGEGAQTATPVRDPSLLGVNLGIRSEKGNHLTDRWQFTVFNLVVLVLVALAVANLRRGGTGRRFLAVRSNERAAAAAGIDVARTKLLAFGISSAIAGIGGVMFAYKATTLDLATFNIFSGIAILAFVYLGGVTSVSGAMVGGMLTAAGLVTYTGNNFFHGFDRYSQAIGGISLIVTAILNPVGISAGLQETGHMIASKIRGRSGTATPAAEVSA